MKCYSISSKKSHQKTATLLLLCRNSPSHSNPELPTITGNSRAIHSTDFHPDQVLPRISFNLVVHQPLNNKHPLLSRASPSATPIVFLAKYVARPVTKHWIASIEWTIHSKEDISSTALSHGGTPQFRN
jgi:hypothetical protein